MRWLVLFVLMLSSQLFAETLLRSKICEEALAANPRFQFGQVTHANETADEFFASPGTKAGQPRFVMTVGVPGSGKTSWVRHADRNEWEVISIDEVRSEIIKRKGLDPFITDNHFQEEILNKGHEIVRSKVELALAQGKSIVLDQNNLTPVRAVWSTLARSFGYFVEALVFSSENVDNNIANIQHRQNSFPEEVVRNRYKQMEFFNQSIQVESGSIEALQVASDIIPYVRLSQDFPNLSSALSQLSEDQRSWLESQLKADYFDDVRFVWVPNLSRLPHDTPALRTAPRVYAAITNKCNRACPWCCVYSNPNKNTFLEPEQLAKHFPTEEKFDLQLEGGEPTIHPKLFDFVNLFRSQKNAGQLILITNGVKLPRTESELKAYLLKFGRPFTIKLSINHYLLERDKLLIEKAKLLKKVVESLGSDYQLIFNVRLRRGEKYGNDAWVLQAVKDASLESVSNIFFLQSYGLASGESEWEPPFTVNDGFKLVNPDGTVHTGTLEDRANKMGELK